MILDVLTGFIYVGVAFTAIMAVCIIIGKLTGLISPYKDR